MTRVWSTNYCIVAMYLGVVALTLFGLAAPAAAADQVPFSDSVTGAFTGATHLPGGLTQFEYRFSGNATYLGNVTGRGTNLVDQQGNFTGTTCVVGANGTDSICTAQSGHNESTKGSCFVTATSTYTVTGGTGSFADATGGGTLTVQADFCAATFNSTATGTISQPNSGGAAVR